MSKGPAPKKAIELALPVALDRGFVIFCKQERGSICNLVLLEPGRTSVIRVVRTKHIRGTVADMKAQFSEAAAGFSLVPPDPGRSLEIWVCNYYRKIRFFRIGATGLVELTRDGKPHDGNAGAGIILLPIPAGGEGVS
jgi:hypothetical protein